jgi:cytochrome b
MWGIVGSQSARFTDFVRSPLAGVRYLQDEVKGRAKEPIGHNPAGGYMILVLLALVLVQAVTGLFTNDDLFFMGPLANWVDYDTSRSLTRLHRNNFDWLLIAVIVHVVAIVLYMVRGKDLLTPMFTGKKAQDANTEGKPPRIVHGGIGFAILVFNLIWVFWWLG